MQLFAYRAMDHQGRIKRGYLSASSGEELELRLQPLGLDLITCSPVRDRSFVLRGRRVARRDLIHFCFQLEQLTAAGVPLVQGLMDLRDSLESSPLRPILAALIEEIRGGRALSDAMATHPAVFDAVFVNLIRVGEQSGELPQVLHELTETLKWQDELAARARKVLLYPAFVAAVVTGVVLFLMVYLVPQLVQFIAAMDGELPLHTRALLALSRFVVDFGWFIIAVTTLVVASTHMAAQRSPRLREELDRLTLRITILGEILRKLALARFARLFALMYRSGVPVLEILDLSQQSVGNRAIGAAVATARTQVSQGESITRAFERTGLFPPLVVRMIGIGETTGGLDRALLNVAYFYDRDVKERIDRVEALVEPAMTLILGALLGWIMLAVLGPIYDLIARIGV